MAARQGECYNPDLSLTEIAAIIRADLKKKFPAYRFSVAPRKGQTKELTISLMESPVEITTKQRIAAYLEPEYDLDMYYDYSIDRNRFKKYITEDEKEEIISEIYRHSRCYSCVKITDTWIAPEVFKALRYAHAQMKKYNRQGKTYTDRNFYSYVNIGKCVRGHEYPVHIVPRSSTGRRLQLFKRTASLAIGG